MREQILGCPHEEDIDYPSGESCPHCPIWAGRPRPLDEPDHDLQEATTRLPNRRAIERAPASFDSSHRENKALEQVQEIMWDAWDEQNPRRRIELARKALRISADCADGFVLLAEESAASLEESIGLFEKGVRAGERALGGKTFSDNEGHFWGILETRPYMRARAGLANCLREAGKIDEAIGHYKDLLRLNPNDNQGNREILAVCLLATGRDAELAELLERYPDDVIAMGMSEALVAFRISGESPVASNKLAKAIKQNPHMPGYLLGRKRMPRRLPGHYAIGSVEEAVRYADLHAENWKKTKGALDWLNRETRGI